MRVADLIEAFAAQRPDDVVRLGGETFLSLGATLDLIAEAERQGVRLLGLEAFLVSEHGVYPALSRIADYSTDAASDAIADARHRLEGAWASAPSAEDQMRSDASGRYMLTVVLAE